MYSYLHTGYERETVPPLGSPHPYSSHCSATLHIKHFYLKKLVKNISAENKNESNVFLSVSKSTNLSYLHLHIYFLLVYYSSLVLDA